MRALRAFADPSLAHSMARSVLGKAYQPLDISSISCRLPSELGDSSYSPTAGQITYNDVSTTDSASMASVVAVHSACLLLAKISKAAGRTRSTSDDVSALHEELDALLHRPSSSSRRPSTPAAEPFASVLTSFAQIRLVGSFPDLHQTPDVQQSYVTHAGKLPYLFGRRLSKADCSDSAVKLLDQVKGVVSASPVVSVYTSIAAATAAIALGFNALGEPFRSARTDKTDFGAWQNLRPLRDLIPLADLLRSDRLSSRLSGLRRLQGSSVAGRPSRGFSPSARIARGKRAGSSCPPARSSASVNRTVQLPPLRATTIAPSLSHLTSCLRALR